MHFQRTKIRFAWIWNVGICQRLSFKVFISRLMKFHTVAAVRISINLFSITFLYPSVAPMKPSTNVNIFDSMSHYKRTQQPRKNWYEKKKYNWIATNHLPIAIASIGIPFSLSRSISSQLRTTQYTRRPIELGSILRSCFLHFTSLLLLIITNSEEKNLLFYSSILFDLYRLSLSALFFLQQYVENLLWVGTPSLSLRCCRYIVSIKENYL